MSSTLIPEVFGRARGDTLCLPISGVNLCLHATHKQRILPYSLKAAYRFATRRRLAGCIMGFEKRYADRFLQNRRAPF